ncbi:MAG: hypothetical protein H8E15_02425 [Planctomycetes bacterium]|nr:hypothetical protein [Planctomycetota bacterium]
MGKGKRITATLLLIAALGCVVWNFEPNEVQGLSKFDPEVEAVPIAMAQIAAISQVGRGESEQPWRNEVPDPERIDLQIKVINARGAPVAGAWVAARKPKREVPWPLVPRREQFFALSKTNADGMARLAGMRKWTMLEIGAWKDGLALTSREASFGGPNSEQLTITTLQMRRGRQVVVQVLSTQGEPVPYAKVRLRVGDPITNLTGGAPTFWGSGKPNFDDRGAYQGYSQMASADETGKLIFPSVPFGVGEVRWKAPGFVNCGNLILGHASGSLGITADPGMQWKGELRNADGEVLAGAKIAVSITDKQPEFGVWGLAVYNKLEPFDVRAVVKKDGSFQISGVPWSQWYRLKIEYRGAIFYAPWHAGSPKFMQVRLPKFNLLRGRVHPNPNPSGYIFLFLHAVKLEERGRALEAPNHEMFLANDDGTFCIPLDAGTFEFSFDVEVTDVEKEDVVDVYTRRIVVDGNLDLGAISLPLKGWKVEREE